MSLETIRWWRVVASLVAEGEGVGERTQDDGEGVDGVVGRWMDCQKAAHLDGITSKDMAGGEWRKRRKGGESLGGVLVLWRRDREGRNGGGRSAGIMRRVL